MSYGAAATVPTSQSPMRGGSTVQKSTAAIKPPAYQLTDVANDWTAILNIRRQFDQGVSLVVDQFYRQRDPDTPYLNIPDRDGSTNLAKQVTDPTMTFLVDKGTAYNLSGEIAVQCPAARNSASPQSLRLCEDLLSFTFDYNEQVAPAHWSQEILHNMLMLSGMAPVEVSYDTGSSNPQMAGTGGFPIKLTLHDPLAVAYEHESDGTLRRVIVAKRVAIAELPDAWKTGTLASRNDYDEVTLFEDWNRVNFGAVVEGDVVATYPHGYADAWGNPFVPFVIGMHNPMITRLGDVPPQLTYGSPRVMRIGRPVWMGLIGMLTYRSFLMTSQRYNIRESLTPFYKLIGKVDIDHDSKEARVPDGPGTGDFTMEEPPNVLQNIAEGLQLTDEMIQSGGASSNAMSGVTPTAASGVAVQGSTALPKQMLEAVRRTHEKVLERVGCMILWMIAGNTEASEPRQFKAQTGMDLHPSVTAQVVQARPKNGTRQPPATGAHPLSPGVLNNGAMAFYEWITGDPRVPIDDLTVAGVVQVRCGITPVDAMPKETRLQMFMNIAQQEAQTGKKVLPDDELYGTIYGASNPQAFQTRIAVDEVLGAPNLRHFPAWREIATERLAANTGSAPQWQQVLTQLDQSEDQALLTAFQAAMAAAQMPPQGGSGQPQAPGAPPAVPGGQPPAGAPSPGQPPAPPPGPPQVPPPSAGPPGTGPFQGGPPQVPPAITSMGGNPMMQGVA